MVGAPGAAGAGEVLRGTVAGPVGEGAPGVLRGMVGAGAGGLGAPPDGAGGLGAPVGAVFRGIVGAGAGGLGAAALGGGVGAEGADGAGGSAFKVTRTVSFLTGTEEPWSGTGGWLSSAIINRGVCEWFGRVVNTSAFKELTKFRVSLSNHEV